MSHLKQCEDGNYRWVYEFHMLRNPVVLLTIWKIFLLILLGMWVVFGLLKIGDFGLPGAFVVQTKELLLPAAILFVLSVVGYLVLAGIYGWKYCVLFEMNETRVRHIQMEKQFKKAQALGWLTAMVGAAAGKPGVAGAGLLSATKNEQVTQFDKVKRMRSLPMFHTIKLDSPLNHNQIYVAPEDYAFVLRFITERIKGDES